jgi:serine/threonine protein kinase
MTTTTSPTTAISIPGYTLGRPIAEGGMAEVYLATQHSLGREVAVKIMKDGDAVQASRFQREARLVATLNHSHIVHIYDVGQLADGRPYLSMELLPGGDLRQRIRDGLKGSEVLRILRQLAEGLQAIHERGIVHRDIKPANILFRENGDAVLTDFGIAKSADIDVELTHGGLIVGSPAYSSPEQISSKSLDGRSDLYSLGIVLVEMLIGRNPYRGPDYATTVVNQMQQSAPLLPSWHKPWQPVVDRLLAKRAEQRYPDAGVLLRVLDKLDLEPKAPVEDSDCTTTSLHLVLDPSILPGATRRRWHIPVALAVLMLLGSLFAWFTFRTDPEINTLLARAEERLREDRLSTPLIDSAAFYYRQVLEQDPANAKAQLGLVAVARRHAELAQLAHGKGNLDRALEHVRQGLKAAPDDPALRLLSVEIPAALARQHGELALRAKAEGDIAGALTHAVTGLGMKPDDAALVALRDELQATLKAQEVERARTRRAQAEQKQVAATKAKDAAAKEAEEKKGFFSRLFGR